MQIIVNQASEDPLIETLVKSILRASSLAVSLMLQFISQFTASDAIKISLQMNDFFNTSSKAVKI